MTVKFNKLSKIEQILRLREYYSSNGLYEHKYYFNHLDDEDTEEFAQFIYLWESRNKALRNVSPRVVDFFALKMLPSNIQIITIKDDLKDIVNQILKWSNFDGNKQHLLSDFALTGDLFIKLVINPDKVFFEYLAPEDVAEIHEDRGFLTDIRIQYSITDDDGKSVDYVEFWDKNHYSVWEGNSIKDRKLEELGDPTNYGLLSEFGISFCPFIHIKFKDLGRPDFMGTGCVEQSLDLIDEVNRTSTNLALQAFREKPVFAVSAKEADSSNFSMTKPTLKKMIHKWTTPTTGGEQNVSSTDVFWQLSAGSTITSLLAGVNWAELDGIIESSMIELSEQLPALKYYAIKESNISNKTLSLLLDAPLSQAKSAGITFTNAIIRACQMCITAGIFSGLFSTSLGKFEKGDFDFTIDSGEVFAMGIEDKITILSGLKANGIELKVAMKMAGFSDDEINKIVDVPIIPDITGI